MCRQILQIGTAQTQGGLSDTPVENSRKELPLPMKAMPGGDLAEENASERIGVKGKGRSRLGRILLGDEEAGVGFLCGQLGALVVAVVAWFVLRAIAGVEPIVGVEDILAGKRIPLSAAGGFVFVPVAIAYGLFGLALRSPLLRYADNVPWGEVYHTDELWKGFDGSMRGMVFAQALGALLAAATIFQGNENMPVPVVAAFAMIAVGYVFAAGLTWLPAFVFCQLAVFAVLRFVVNSRSEDEASGTIVGIARPSSARESGGASRVPKEEDPDTVKPETTSSNPKKEKPVTEVKNPSVNSKPRKCKKVTDIAAGSKMTLISKFEGCFIDMQINRKGTIGSRYGILHENGSENWGQKFQAIPSMECLQNIYHHTPVTAFTFLPSGNQVFFGTKVGDVGLMDSTHNGMQIIGRHGTTPIRGIATSLDGKIGLTRGEDMAVKVWDLSEKSLIASFPAPMGTEHIVSITANGDIAFAGGYKETVFWDIAAKKEILSTIPLCDNGVQDICMAEEGRTVIIGGLDGSVQCLVIPESIKNFSRIVYNIGKHLSNVSSVAISSDGSIGASIDSNRILKIWDLKQKVQICEEIVNSKSISLKLSMTADGSRLFLGTASELFMWRIGM